MARKEDWQTYRVAVCLEVDAVSAKAAEQQIAEILRYVRCTGITVSEVPDNAATANKYGPLKI